MKHAQDELVWIDGSGAAHPLGEVATQRMRTREGAFRVMPSPQHLVFMRYVGADGRRDREDGAVVRLAGEITGPGTIADIIALLAQVGWRGELVVQDSEHARSLFFEHGSIVGVQSDAREELLGTIAYRFGAVSEDALSDVLARMRKTGEKWGVAAVAIGALSEEKVLSLLGRQVEEVVFAALQVDDGLFAFLDGFDDSRIAFRQVHSATSLLMHLMVRLDGIRYFRPWIPSSQYIPGKRPGAARPKDAELLPLWEAIDGERSVEQLGRITGLGEFQVTEMLFKLTQSQHVIILPPRLRGGAVEAVELANTALRAIHQRADSAGRGTALRNALAGFARGAYDDLFRGAGPFEHGGLVATVVERNANDICAALGGEAETMVREMMYDYVAFALFSCSASLGKSDEQGLSREVEPLLAKLRPPSQSGIFMVSRR